MSDSKRARLAVSSCLLGENVRYDGRHKENKFILFELSQHFELISICPEIMMGLGVPRPPIIAAQSNGAVEIFEREGGLSLNEKAQETYRVQLKNIIESVHGVILKAKSPSCALKPLSFKANEMPAQGYFASAFQRDFPNHAFIDEIDLKNIDLFIRFAFKASINFSGLSQSVNEPEYDWIRLLANRLAT